MSWKPRLFGDLAPVRQALELLDEAKALLVQAAPIPPPPDAVITNAMMDLGVIRMKTECLAKELHALLDRLNIEESQRRR